MTIISEIMEFRTGQTVKHIGRSFYQHCNMGQVVFTSDRGVVVDFPDGRQLVSPKLLIPSIAEVA